MSEQELPGPPQPESRYFNPTVRCPNPACWHSTDGDSTEIEVSEFIGALCRAAQPDLVVETGAAWGQTTLALAIALAQNGHGKLISLETDAERADYARRRVEESVPDWFWAVLEESSLEWTPAVTQRIDVLFSDTAREIRVDEILRFQPWLRQGTLVVVHDSAWDMGPLRGWLENNFVGPGFARAIDLPTPRGLTILEWL